MGYYTKHELEVSVGHLMDHVEAIEKISGYSDLFESGHDCKWYSHEKDMREHSRQHPAVIFTLSGEGEENGDLWIEYYQNGEMQRCKAKITYDDYDKNKLS